MQRQAVENGIVPGLILLKVVKRTIEKQHANAAISVCKVSAKDEQHRQTCRGHLEGIRKNTDTDNNGENNEIISFDG